MSDSKQEQPELSANKANETDADAGAQYSIKGLMVTAVLVLPLAFFIWFYLSGVLVMPTGWLLEAATRLVLTDAVHDVTRNAYQLNVQLLVNPPPGMTGRGQAIAEIPLNPMIYGYGLALAGGLIFCIPGSGLRRAIQLGITFVLVTLVQSWGCFWELLKDLAISQVLGPDGIAMVAKTGLSNDMIGFAYQFGYLMSPSIVPIVGWIIMNRQFIEGLVQPGVFGPRK